MLPDHAILAILGSGVIAGALLLAAWLLARRGSGRPAQLVAALAAAAGFAFGYLALEERPKAPPTDVGEWLLVLAPVALGAGALEVASFRERLRLLPRILYAGLATFLIARPLYESWSGIEAALSTAGAVLFGAGLLTTLPLATERLEPRFAAIATFAVVSGTSFLLLFGANQARVAFLAAVLAAPAGASVVLSLARLGLERARAFAATTAALAVLQWIRGYLYAEVRPAARATLAVGLLLLVATPLVALLGDRLAAKLGPEKKPALAALLRLASIALPVALALALVATTAAPLEAAGAEGE